MLNIVWLQAIHGAWNTYRSKMNSKVLSGKDENYTEELSCSGKTVEEIAEEAFIAGFSAGARHANIFMSSTRNYEVQLN